VGGQWKGNEVEVEEAGGRDVQVVNFGGLLLRLVLGVISLSLWVWLLGLGVFMNSRCTRACQWQQQQQQQQAQAEGVG